MFCFFKQKTAYDMRISDLSSDVCSSDLTNTTSSDGYFISIWNTDHVESYTTITIPWKVILPIELSFNQEYTQAQDGWNYFYLSLQIGIASCRESVCQYV